MWRRRSIRGICLEGIKTPNVKERENPRFLLWESGGNAFHQAFFFLKTISAMAIRLVEHRLISHSSGTLSPV